MDTKDFIDFGKAAIDFVANYTETLREKNVLPNVEPRYLFNLLPEKAPQKPESWQEVFKDIERYIIPGVRRLQFLILLFIICSLLPCLIETTTF